MWSIEPAACQIRLGGQQKKGVREFRKLEKTSFGPPIPPSYDSRRKDAKDVQCFQNGAEASALKSGNQKMGAYTRA